MVTWPLLATLSNSQPQSLSLTIVVKKVRFHYLPWKVMMLAGSKGSWRIKNLFWANGTGFNHVIGSCLKNQATKQNFEPEDDIFESPGYLHDFAAAEKFAFKFSPNCKLSSHLPVPRVSQRTQYLFCLDHSCRQYRIALWHTGSALATLNIAVFFLPLCPMAYDLFQNQSSFPECMM